MRLQRPDREDGRNGLVIEVEREGQVWLEGPGLEEGIWLSDDDLTWLAFTALPAAIVERRRLLSEAPAKLPEPLEQTSIPGA